MAIPNLPRALLADAWAVSASDIHLEPHSDGLRVRLRLYGVVWDVAHVPPGPAKTLLNQFKALAGLDPVARFTPTDVGLTFQAHGESLDLRLVLTPGANGEALVVRLLDRKRLERSIGDLGLSAASLKLLREWLAGMNGMFLAAGPTGCGKTTTVYALLQELKATQRVIVSLEDPVEYQIDGLTQIQINELKGLDFAEGIKAMLRMDPDHLVLGEIRDAASAQAAVQTAITGRVLLSTIHSRDAVGAVTALRNWELSDREISEALAVVVAQRLVRTLCPKCRRAAAPTKPDAAWLKSVRLPHPKKVWYAPGCPACKGLGYGGRTGVFEIWRLNSTDYDDILNHAPAHVLREALAKRKHQTFLWNAWEKLNAGVTGMSEVRRMAAGLVSA
jgi:general secretion pathway protein E